MEMRLSVVIPTYGRDQPLLDTLRDLIVLEPRPVDILVVDQTECHSPETTHALETLAAEGRIRWIRGRPPCIPCAMNRGLSEARGDIVLFLDDDIRPEPELFQAHLAAHAAWPEVVVAGRVIQPWEEGKDLSNDHGFHFASLHEAWCGEFMEGNFSVPRPAATEIGGFDENFVQVAYRFGAEFSHRWLGSGRRIRYAPDACLHHLKIANGGTRVFGEHLRTWQPAHAVGAYYYFMRTRPPLRAWMAAAVRLLTAARTRYHLTHPWRIPATLWAEWRGLLWARRLLREGPRYLAGHGRRR